MSGVFAVKDDENPLCFRFIKKQLLQILSRVDIHGTSNMSTIILILKTAVDNQDIIIVFLVFTIHDLTQYRFVDTSQGIILDGKTRKC